MRHTDRRFHVPSAQHMMRTLSRFNTWPHCTYPRRRSWTDGGRAVPWIYGPQSSFEEVIRTIQEFRMNRDVCG